MNLKRNIRRQGAQLGSYCNYSNKRCSKLGSDSGEKLPFVQYFTSLWHYPLVQPLLWSPFLHTSSSSGQVWTESVFPPPQVMCSMLLNQRLLWCCSKECPKNPHCSLTCTTQKHEGIDTHGALLEWRWVESSMCTVLRCISWDSSKDPARSRIRSSGQLSNTTLIWLPLLPFSLRLSSCYSLHHQRPCPPCSSVLGWGQGLRQCVTLSVSESCCNEALFHVIKSQWQKCEHGHVIFQQIFMEQHFLTIPN